MILDTHGVLGPVTALRVYRNRIFAGCGSEIQVYSTNSCDFLASFPAFSSATVHGLELGPDVDARRCLCVFGAKCSRIFLLEVENSDSGDPQTANHIRLEAASDVKEFEDWIWAAVWLQNPGNEKQSTVAFALAHNVIIHWDWQTGTILQRVTCVEKCILYCGHFIGHQWSDLVLAAGTVFNQVVLWSPCGHAHMDSGSDPVPQQPVLLRLTGHQGVIFSIFYHEGLQRLCSVSDDRSIIMYQLHFHPSSVKSSTDGDSVSEDWNHVTIEPTLNVFGHSARVWDVVLLKDCFVSVGEDAHCIVWDYSGEILHKHKRHKGQSIWSLAASEEETFVVTGGGDCSIRKWQLCVNRNLSLTQNQLTIPHNVKTCAEDFVRTLVLWDYDSVVLTTNTGSTLCYDIQTNRWKTLVHDADFASYASVAASADRSFLAMGSISGHVRVLCKDPGSEHGVCETKVKVHSGKVCGLTWVNNDHFLTTGLQGHCVLVRVQQSAEEGLHVSTVASLELPACRHRWVVSGCLLSVSSSSSSSLSTQAWSHLVCGDRSGSVHCYDLSHSVEQTESVLQPKQTFSKIHGSAGVTCVYLYNDTVYTAGRDGHYRRWSLNRGCLQLLNSSRVFKGFDWIDRLWIGDHGLFVLGFYSSKFIVWDTSQGERLLEIECGGGHRSWDCLSLGQDYRFCFIKAREVVIVNGGQRSTQDIVKPPLHGKKIWEMKCLSTHTDETGVVHHVMCTGSEDTTLSLGVLQSDLAGRLQWRSHHTLHGHLSSVRAVAAVRSACTRPRLEREGPGHQDDHCPQACSADVSAHPPGERDRFSNVQGSTAVVFSAGGRAQIQAWRVTVSEQDVHSHQKLKKVGKSSNSPHINSVDTSSAVYSATEQLQNQDVTGGRCVEKNVYQNMASPSSSETTHDRLDNSTEHKTTSTSPGSGENSFNTRYEHLGGCFLGESRHKRSHKPWKTRYLKLDPETRVMSLAAVTAQQLDSTLSAHWCLLAAAGSDGVLRLFLFDGHRRQFTLLCQSSHHNGCILKVLIHLHPHHHHHNTQPDSSSHSSTSDPLPFLLSAATDGRIAVWNLQPVVRWLRAYNGHMTPDSEGITGEEKAGCHHKSSAVGNKPDPGAASYESCQAQERTSDESSEEEEEANDDETGIQHASAVQSVTTRTQYLGDVPPPLFGPSSGRSAAAAGSPAGEQSKDQAAADGEERQGWIPNQELVAHQSGVNSLHIKSLTDGSLLMASGGDDNALTVHRLRVTEKAAADTVKNTDGACEGPLFDVTGKVCKTDAHAAQITGVWILSENRVLTASIDQRVNLWNVAEDLQVTFERCRFVNLADPSNLEIWQHEDRVYAGLCGEGMALLSVQGRAADEDASV